MKYPTLSFPGLKHSALLCLGLYASVTITSAVASEADECDAEYDDAVSQCESDANSTWTFDQEFDACRDAMCETSSDYDSCINRSPIQSYCANYAAVMRRGVAQNLQQCKDDAATEWGDCLVNIGPIKDMETEESEEEDCGPMEWLRAFDSEIYFHYLTHPSQMDPDLEVAWDTALVTAGAAGGTATCLYVVSTTAAGTAATLLESNALFGSPSGFGAAVGWGTGPQAAIARTAALRSGAALNPNITRPIALYWRNFFKAAVAQGKGGPTAPQRVLLMEEVLRHL